MNYGKKNVRRKRKRLLSKGMAVRHRVQVIVLLVLAVLVIGGIGYVGFRANEYLQDVLADTPDIDTIDATPEGYMSVVLDSEGNQTAKLVATGSNRVYVTLDEVPLDLQHAFVAIEDERFYEHNGIDIKGIIRAGIKGITSGRLSEGASTLTQQLLKNNVFVEWTEEKTDEERIQRKLKEQYLAIQLEKKYSKEWIMQNYLNTINLGQNTLGVEAAAQRYFGKNVEDLNLSECAVIAGITQNPSKYNPISHPENNAVRREKVLENMKEQGYISQAEYDEAMEDRVYERITENNGKYVSSSANVTSYFVDALTKEVVKDLQTELGYSEAAATQMLYSGGLTIYSTQDPTIQKYCDEAANNSENYENQEKISFSYALTIQNAGGELENYSEQTMLTYLKENKIRDSLNFSSEESAQTAVEEYRDQVLAETGGILVGENLSFLVEPQVSMTVMEQSTGQVKALVGGRGEKTASRTLNRATDTTRQPGSTFKIISTYSPALDSGQFTLATTVKDEPITYANGKQVRNAGGQYRGDTTIRSAIQHSINVVAIKTSREISLETCYDSLLNYGITTVPEEDIVEALPLGGVSAGVTNLELTAAYAAIANGGMYQEPILYTKILDHEGRVLLEKKPETHRVIKKSTAFLLTSAMQDVLRPGGTGTLAALDGMSVAGKTGTTTSTRDNWFVGFTPYYTCAVWGGYDDNSVLESTRYIRLVWKDAMSEIHSGLEDIGFPVPDSVKKYTVCQISGKLAVEGQCTSTYTEYFSNTTAPDEVCSSHVTAVICTESGQLAGDYCPEECKETRSFVKDASDPEQAVPEEICQIHTGTSLLDTILDHLLPPGEMSSDQQ